jgi:hypothetical protein
MTDSVLSRAGVPIRLTDERWRHIIEGHAELTGMRDEVLAAVAHADRVVAGGERALLAFRIIVAG